MITGKTLVAWGYAPGAWFKDALAAAQAAEARGAGEDAIRAIVDEFAPRRIETVPLRPSGALTYHVNIRPETSDDAENIAHVSRHMSELMRVPTVVGGAVMPDACASGSAPGTIPVGGVVSTRNAIHPGMHSADICCSMAVTVFGKDATSTRLLDAGMRLSHFGAGGRRRGEQHAPPSDILTAFEANAFLKPHLAHAVEHHATQGDGNHFLYVGRLASSDQVTIVTHHGSWKPGAMLYKSGMATAERMTAERSPETPRHNAWIPADTPEGEAYWAALQTIRAWTKSSHFRIHDLIAEALGLRAFDRFWNEHNFVFQRDGLYYHAKGATPAYRGFAPDDSGLTLIPLNMAEPILVARGLDARNGLGFAPHGAGRNLSRTAYLRRHTHRTEAEIVTEQTRGIDCRFFFGIPDVSELPGAYKSAAAVRAQIAEFGLAEIVDTIEPIGCIMAGDWQRNAPWRKKRMR
jgi:tRNA-splicing ligase RtcB (3'-phosphate/5'-hydroxy nucleic acid ligase)